MGSTGSGGRGSRGSFCRQSDPGRRKAQPGDGYFQINLHRSKGEATVLYVNARGEVAVAANMDLNHYRYYKGGEELYEALSALCADKTVYLALTGSI